MVRLARDGAVFDVWIEKTTDGEQLWARDNEGPPREIETHWKYSVGSDLDVVLLERLTSGWHRLPDPAHEPVLPAEPIEPEIEAALLASPGDRSLALVYADWYQQQHHPRGDLIAIQCARAERPTDDALLEAERALFDDHGDRLLFPIGQPRESYHLGVDLEWEHGFVRAARIHGKDRSNNAVQLLWEVLRHPSTRFVRELVLGCHSFGDQDNQLTTALLLHGGITPPLRKLVLADFDDSELDNIDISRAWLGDLAGISTKYPLLEDVVIKGRGIGARDNAKLDAGLHDLALLHARRFAFRTSGMTAETLAAILAAPWPELTELELWIGTGEYGCTAKLEHVLPLFSGDRVPKLRRLRLMNCQFTDALVPVVCDFAQRRGLELVDFSLGTLSDDGADVLIARRDALASVRELYVFESCLSQPGLARLRASGLPIIDTQPFPGDGWYHSDYDRIGSQKNDRYISVTE